MSDRNFNALENGRTALNMISASCSAMGYTFISHSSQDRQFTERLCNLLHSAEIDTWVSFRDVPLGAEFDKTIEQALSKATSLIVVASKASIASGYVLSEVEEAISSQKTVIPVLLESVSLPLRWRRLQFVKWDEKASGIILKRIVAALPPSSATAFAAALSNPGKGEEIKRLVLAHPEWLPLEFRMAGVYSYKVKPIIAGSPVDYFAGRLDTGGPRAFLYYLGSPYAPPFTSGGAVSRGLRHLLDIAARHRNELLGSLDPANPIAPRNLFRQEADAWKWIPDRYAVLTCYIFIGRRHQRSAFRDSERTLTAAFEAETVQKSIFARTTLDLMSYDRILESIAADDPRSSNELS